MVKVNVATLKSELSKYLELAQRGEQVVITSHGQEIAKIGPVQLNTSASVNWEKFFQNNPPIKPKKKGIEAAKLIRHLRDEE